MILLSSTGESIFQLLVVLFCFVVVLILTYYTTRWMAGYQKSHSYNKNLSVVETLKLSNNRYVQLIRVGKHTYYAVAIGKDEVSVIGKIEEEDLVELSDVTSGDIPTVKGDFQDILNKVKERLPKK